LASVLADRASTRAVSLAARAGVAGPVAFESLAEVSVLPLTAETYCKQPMEIDDRLNAELRAAYDLDYDADVAPYVTTPVFVGGAGSAARAFDLVQGAQDRSLWLALVAARPEDVVAVRNAIGGRILNVGVAPSGAPPQFGEDILTRRPLAHVWETSTGRDSGGESDFLTLDVLSDSSGGLTRQGVLRLRLPAASELGAPENDARVLDLAGVADRPPRLDDAALAARVVAWLRLRPTERLENLALDWVGVNAVEIEQRVSSGPRVVGQANGQSGFELALGATSVDAASLRLQVEEPNQGYRDWAAIDELAAAGRDARVFELDAEAGTLRFGDGVRGRRPEAGMRIRVLNLAAGGGVAGNLPPGVLTGVRGRALEDGTPLALKIVQALPTQGGANAETLDEAEARIPERLRHRERAVTAADYRVLAAHTPGARVGRVEVLPRFKPQQRRPNVPGVVTVMVLPARELSAAPNPRADRALLEAVHAELAPRVPLATELYVVGCEYVPLAVTVAVSLRAGATPDTTAIAVRDALRAFLWPLAPGGVEATGWPLGRRVVGNELEAACARVSEITAVNQLKLFRPDGARWQEAGDGIELDAWQLPELLAVLVTVGERAADSPAAAPDPWRADKPAGIALPVVPEPC
jgi:predicted phage baseplate assembly protein